MTSSRLIVWLDDHGNDSVSSFRDKLTQDPYVKIFTEIDPCLAFIRTHVHERIFFIVSGSFGSNVVPLVYDFEHIYQIYLFCGSIAAHTSWAVDYVDKLLAFDHEDDLLQRLFKEIEGYLRQQAEEYFEQAKICQERAQLFKQPQCG